MQNKTSPFLPGNNDFVHTIVGLYYYQNRFFLQLTVMYSEESYNIEIPAALAKTISERDDLEIHTVTDKDSDAFNAPIL